MRGAIAHKRPGMETDLLQEIRKITLELETLKSKDNNLNKTESQALEM